MGNVVMHDFTKTGDIAYGPQSERTPGLDVQRSTRRRSPTLPLGQGAFQIRGVQRVYRKWKYFRARLRSGVQLHSQRAKATVYVAVAGSLRKLDWLSSAQGFTDVGKNLEVGFWGWPYRYRNRPADKTATSYAIFAKQFPAGEVGFGQELRPTDMAIRISCSWSHRCWPMRTFTTPCTARVPDGWRVEPNGGMVEVVDNPDYDAEIRPTVFDLRTVPRYTPLDLQSLELKTTVHSTAPPRAELPFASEASSDFVVQFRAKAGQTNQASFLHLVTENGEPAVTICFNEKGRITALDPKGAGVDVAPYEPLRWYNVTIDVSRKNRRCRVRVQDDHVNESMVENVPLAGPRRPSRQGNPDRARAGSLGFADRLRRHRRIRALATGCRIERARLLPSRTCQGGMPSQGEALGRHVDLPTHAHPRLRRSRVRASHPNTRA